MAVSRLRFKGTTNGTYYIDVWRAISLQERKLHRQKNICTVYGGYFVDSQANRIDINTAALTWMNKRAVNRGFRIWKSMIADTLKSTDGLSTGRWNDFKVYLNKDQFESNALLPVDANGGALWSGGSVAPEWNYSTLTSEDPDGPGGTLPDAFELMIAGGAHSGNDPDWSRISLIKSWIESRGQIDTSGQPFVDTGAIIADPLNNLMDAGDADDDRMLLAMTEGEDPPYDQESMFGSISSSGGANNLQRQSVAQPSAQVPVAPIHGFTALCGLLQIQVGSDSASNAWELVLDVETKGESF
jgi:hypothetical protein